MESVEHVLSMDNPLFKAYLFYSAVLVAKMMLMSFLTGRMRFKRKAFANLEDAALVNKTSTDRDKDVERIRRSHLNDLENIPIHFVISFAYLFTDPSPTITLMLFRIYVTARWVHTLVYAVYPIPPPARGIAWITGFLVTAYMALSTIIYFRAI